MKGMGMEQDREYRIDKSYLYELIDSTSRSIVGKVMKRFELSTNPSDIKTQTKELIYEELRNFKSLLDAHQSGYERQLWKFTSKKKEDK